MRWECSECSAHVERPRAPSLCRACGTAGAIFVEAEMGIEGDPDADSILASWTQRGVDRDPPELMF